MNSSRNPQLIAMVHVQSSNVFTNTKYNELFGTSTYTLADLKVVDEVRQHLFQLSTQVVSETAIPFLSDCRIASFVLKKEMVQESIEKITKLGFVQQLIQKALLEVDMYWRNGIRFIEIENVGAPYFIGRDIPLEELLILHVVALKIRNAFPQLAIGIQVLSCGELEALPIALACGATFIRSEASLFKGLRPEGETNNQGNLAKFYYLRNYLNSKLGVELPENRRLPALWCDLQKKHTVFNNELGKLETWLGNMLFQKMEGIVLTGAETGSDIAENDLLEARNAITHGKEKLNEIAGAQVNIELPLITGSGSNIEMYQKYADFIILGTYLKKNRYWENAVDEAHVQEMVKRFNN